MKSKVKWATPSTHDNQSSRCTMQKQHYPDKAQNLYDAVLGGHIMEFR